ncbi:TPA: hypothetical protein ACXJQH_006043 [Pseudomonas aeruginosa]
MNTSPDSTSLVHFLYWERTAPDAVYLTQPFTHKGSDGRVVDYTWREVGD